MTRSRTLSFVPAWLAVALLIAAEAFAVVHAADLDAHTGGEACKICLSVSPLDGASPINGWALPIVVVPAGVGHSRRLVLRAVPLTASIARSLNLGWRNDARLPGVKP